MERDASDIAAIDLAIAARGARPAAQEWEGDGGTASALDAPCARTVFAQAGKIEETDLIMLAEIFSREEAQALCDELMDAPFRDGVATAGPAAGRVKANEQARPEDPAVLALARRVRLAMEADPVVRSFARPTMWSNLIFSRYGPGQHYGLHVDNATMYAEGGWPLRTDLSFTLFLSDPEAYEGGALSIRDFAGDREFRPQAGVAVLYPTGCLHAVTPVRRGVRLACVGWMQSRIRRPDQREILHDLEAVRDGAGAEDAALRLDKTIGNLLRMWGED